MQNGSHTVIYLCVSQEIKKLLEGPYCPTKDKDGSLNFENVALMAWAERLSRAANEVML